MLPRIEPDLRIAMAHFEAINRLAFDAVAKAAIGHAFQRCRLGNQTMVAFHAIGSEISKPCKIACGGVTNGQCPAIFCLVIGRIGAAPIIAVFGDASPVIGPATGIGAAFQSGNLQRKFFACGACNAEVKPLREFRILVLADTQRRNIAVDGVNDDVAAVEGGIDVSNRHKILLPHFVIPAKAGIHGLTVQQAAPAC